MKSSWITLSIASILIILVVTYLYYSSYYTSHSNLKYNHENRYYTGYHGDIGFHRADLSHILSFREDLELKEDQLKQLENLIFTHKRNLINYEKSSKIAHMDIERQLGLESLNEKRIQELASQIGDIESKLIEQFFNTRINLARLLTKKQRDKIKNIYDNFNEEFN